MEPVADLGGGGHTRPVPPPLKLFCTIAPPPFWNVKKMFRNTEMCRISPPPPPPPDLRDSRRWWRSEKKGRNPPPPLIRVFLGLARLSRLARRSKKLTVFCAPPPPIYHKILDPPLDGAMERWEEGKWMWGKQRMKINHCYLFMTDLHYVTCSHCIFLKGSDKIWKLVQGLR